MHTFNKVKKTIPKYIEDGIITGDITLVDKWGELINEIEIKASKYKLNLSNNKQFMKKWTDRQLNLAIKKDLSLLEKELLFDCLDYIDGNNIINFKLIAQDYGYSPSKISKGKHGLKSKGLIKDINGIYFLNPLMGIKSHDIPQELILMFKDEFEMYGINIKYN